MYRSSILENISSAAAVTKRISASSLEYTFLSLHDTNAKAHRTLTDHISPLPNSFKRLLNSDVGFQGVGRGPMTWSEFNGNSLENAKF